jgi:hypothetical protein
MTDLALRFLLGGTIVSAFAVLGDVLRPKTFAGLFGAAPSVALATLGLTFWAKGGTVVASEGRSMLAGAVAMGAAALLACPLLARLQLPALVTAGAGWAAWGAVALLLWIAVLR